MLSPDRVGEPVGRDDLAACEHQHGEYGALPPPTQIEHATVNEEDSFRHRLRGR